MCRSTPLCVASISTSVFSDSMTTIGSPFWTRPPTATGHTTTFPSFILIPSRGIAIGVAMVVRFPARPRRHAATRVASEQLAHGRQDLFHRGHVTFLEHAAERHWRKRRRDVLHRSIEQIKALIDTQGGDVAGNSASRRRFVDHHEEPRLSERGENRLLVEELQGAQD